MSGDALFPWPGRDSGGYRISVTTTERRDRGLKTLELHTFHWDPTSTNVEH